MKRTCMAILVIPIVVLTALIATACANDQATSADPASGSPSPPTQPSGSTSVLVDKNDGPGTKPELSAGPPTDGSKLPELPTSPSAEAQTFVDTSTPSSTSKPTTPIEVDLRFSNSPLLGRDVELIFTVAPHLDVATGTVEFIVPLDGFEVVKGPLEWIGSMTVDEERAFAVVVRAVGKGDWTVSATFLSLYRFNQRVGNRVLLYVSVSEDNSTISYTRTLCPRTVEFAPGVNQRDTIQSPGARFDGEVGFSAPPILGNEVELTLLLTPKEDFFDVRVDLQVPELGFELISGTPRWVGTFSAGVQMEFTLVLKPVRPGDWRIGVDVFGRDERSEPVRVKLRLYPYVTEDGAMVGNIEPYDCLRPGPAPSVQTEPNSRY